MATAQEHLAVPGEAPHLRKGFRREAPCLPKKRPSFNIGPRHEHKFGAPERAALYKYLRDPAQLSGLIAVRACFLHF